MLTSDDLGKLVLRLSLGIFILLHGVNKLFDISGTVGWMSSVLQSHHLPGFIAYGVFVGEVIAPIMLILGIYSRIGGLIIAVNMIFAVLLVHTSELLVLGSSGGWALELQGTFFFMALVIFLIGGGRYALKGDGLFFK